MKTKHRNDYTKLHGLYKHILILTYSSGVSTVSHILCVTRNTNEAASLWSVNEGGGLSTHVSCKLRSVLCTKAEILEANKLTMQIVSCGLMPL